MPLHNATCIGTISTSRVLETHWNGHSLQSNVLWYKWCEHTRSQYISKIDKVFRLLFIPKIEYRPEKITATGRHVFPTLRKWVKPRVTTIWDGAMSEYFREIGQRAGPAVVQWRRYPGSECWLIPRRCPKVTLSTPGHFSSLPNLICEPYITSGQKFC